MLWVAVLNTDVVFGSRNYDFSTEGIDTLGESASPVDLSVVASPLNMEEALFQACDLAEIIL